MQTLFIHAVVGDASLNTNNGMDEGRYGNNIQTNEITPSDNSKIVMEHDNIFFGSKAQLDDTKFGQIGWGMAEALYSKYW